MHSEHILLAVKLWNGENSKNKDYEMQIKSLSSLIWSEGTHQNFNFPLDIARWIQEDSEQQNESNQKDYPDTKWMYDASNRSAGWMQAKGCTMHQTSQQDGSKYGCTNVAEALQYCAGN
eukprot:1152565-Pelagomonas_calceolata.AAC.15